MKILSQIALTLVVVVCPFAHAFADTFTITEETRMYRRVEDIDKRNACIRVLLQGQKAEILEEKDGWMKVKFKANHDTPSTTGYMKSIHKPQPAQAGSKEVIAPKVLLTLNAPKVHNEQIDDKAVKPHKLHKRIVKPVVKNEPEQAKEPSPQHFIDIAPPEQKEKEIAISDSIQMIEAQVKQLVATKENLLKQTVAQKQEIDQLKVKVSENTETEAVVGILNDKLKKLTSDLADARNGLESVRADSKRQIDALQAEQDSLRRSPGLELFNALDAKGETATLRGFGSIRMIPINNDYLIMVPLGQLKQAEAFMSRVKPVEIIGKSYGYFIFDKRFITTQTEKKG